VAWVIERVEAHYGIQEMEKLKGSLVLDCECGEKMLLIGKEDHWRWGNTLLECGGCEEKFLLL
jgi:predicted SprT family Zn-dependent metalloprotease